MTALPPPSSALIKNDLAQQGHFRLFFNSF